LNEKGDCGEPSGSVTECDRKQQAIRETIQRCPE